MKRLASWIMAVTVVTLAASSLIALPLDSKRVKGPIDDATLDEDSVNSLTIHAQGSSVILRWHRQSEAIECFVVRAFQTNFADAETLFATPDSSWVDNNVLSAHPRAFYWIIPRFAQQQPHDTDQIEDFDGSVVFTSYPNQDAEPDSFRFPVGGTINPGGRVLELYGNTWKREAITPVHLHNGSVWRIAVKFLVRGELQAIGKTYTGQIETIARGFPHLVHTFTFMNPENYFMAFFSQQIGQGSSPASGAYNGNLPQFQLLRHAQYVCITLT